MKRETHLLSETEFDLVVIGGGINGLACARDAALRGLKVAVIEKKDFGGQTSSNSAKIAHCGMRYLQHLDFKRMRESIRERNAMHQLAPHLVESQPFLMPIYGHGVKGRETLTIYMKAYDWLSPERKQFKDDYRKVPDSSIISPEEVKKLVPYIETEKLTGGVVWYEGQMQNTERLSFGLLRSAVELGAVAANYTEVTAITHEGKTVTGLQATDLLSGEQLEVRARYVLNAAGPWINKVFALSDLPIKDHGIYASKAFSLLTRSISDVYALTFPIRPMYEDKKAVIDKKNSLQFAIPWRGKSMFASLHLTCDEDPEKVSITNNEIKTYLDRINEGLPGINLTMDDVDHILWGIIPAESKGEAAPLKHYKIIDHQKEEGITGFGTVVGVKYTTSRDVAEKTVNMVCTQLHNSNRCKTASTPIWGGDIEYFEPYVAETVARYQSILPEELIVGLIKTYGTGCHDVIEMAQENAAWLQAIGYSRVIGGQIVYAVREELAVSLSDVVFRRTELGSLQYPGDEAVQTCANLMAAELGWSSDEIAAQIDKVKTEYQVYP